MTRTRIAALLCAATALWAGGCKPEPGTGETPYTLNIPAGWGQPVIPADNPLTVAKVELGRRLFFDTILSADGKLSCGGCHHPDKAFTDGQALSPAAGGQFTKRNAPALANVAWLPHYMWDAGLPTLESQVQNVILNKVEFNEKAETLIAKLAANAEYAQAFKEAFPQEGITFNSIAKAVASFERTLISANSKYDRVQQGQALFTEAEKRGFDLFMDEGGDCFHCHIGNNLTNSSLQNTGLDSVSRDPGRYDITFAPEDMGKMKTPTLRNVALTAPYMHDGRFATLEQVLDHYSSGGQPHPQRSGLMRPLNLTEQQKQDIIAFLHTLTDEQFVQQSISLQDR